MVTTIIKRKKINSSHIFSQIKKNQDKFTLTLPLLEHLQIGQKLIPRPQATQRQRWRHGSSSTVASFFPQLLHALIDPTTDATISSLSPQQQDSASSTTARSSMHRRCSSFVRSCVVSNTCSRLVRRRLALASLVCASSRHIWLSMDRLRTLSSNAILILFARSIS